MVLLKRGEGMKIVWNSGVEPVQKYSYNGDFCYIHFKKHFCPVCKSKLKVKFVVDLPHNALGSSKWSGRNYYANGVERNTPRFYCKKCDRIYRIAYIKEREAGKG
mgnify:CR=1 FL=1